MLVLIGEVLLVLWAGYVAFQLIYNRRSLSDEKLVSLCALTRSLRQICDDSHRGALCALHRQRAADEQPTRVPAQVPSNLRRSVLSRTGTSKSQTQRRNPQSFLARQCNGREAVLICLFLPAGTHAPGSL